MKREVRRWMRPSGWGVEPPYFAVYRNCFEIKSPVTLRFEYSADERATLFCDGKVVAEGPARGTVERWYSATVEIPLEPGKHVLTARLLAFGKNLTAYAQMSIAPGLWINDLSGILADWEYQLSMGCTFASSKTDWGSYAHLLTDEDYNWQAIEGKGGEWLPAVYVDDERNMEPSPLPAMRNEEILNYRRKGSYFLFEDYVCAFGEYEFSGTGEVRLRWVEPGCDTEELPENFGSLRKTGEPYPCFAGPGDRFRLTGGKVRWREYGWHAGRTLEMTMYGDVKLESVHFYRTGYPLKLNRDITIPGNDALNLLLKKSWLTLQACSYETLMDCPYYEQLQYISDSRFDLLVFYNLTDDQRLIENALRQFAEGQYPEGFLSCRYPTKEAESYVPQHGEYYRIHIPAFSAFFVQLVHDYARYGRNKALVAELLPVCRRVADYMSRNLTSDGLLRLPGWNFIDWLDNWEGGVPPECENGEGCTLNLIWLQSLKNLAEMEELYGSAENAAQYRNRADIFAANIRKNYFVPEKNCFAENKSHTCFSEHAQVFALLALGETAVIPALRKGDLDQCNIAFSFYYLEVCRAYKLDDLYQKRLGKYIETAALPAFKTIPECFPDGGWLRSNCHAWGSHALYHTFAKSTIIDKL